MKVIRNLICSKCGSDGVHFSRTLYNGTRQVGVRCPNCGHERIDYEFSPESEHYLLDEESTDEF